MGTCQNWDSTLTLTVDNGILGDHVHYDLQSWTFQHIT